MVLHYCVKESEASKPVFLDLQSCVGGTSHRLSRKPMRKQHGVVVESSFCVKCVHLQSEKAILLFLAGI